LPSVIVSVVIPAYNAADFLQEAISSLQAQSLRDWEAIIVDDASTDDTLAIAKRLATIDERVRVITLPRNAGPGIARNAGIAMARGEWIGVLDADDVYLPERLERLVSAASRLRADVIADNQWLRDPTHGRITRSGLPRSRAERKLDLLTIYLESCGADGFDYGNLKPLVKREFIERTQVSYRHFRCAEDFAFLAELLAAGAQAWLIHQPYYIYTLSLSEIDGRKSARSRTWLDLEEVGESNRCVLERYGSQLSQAEIAAIRKRDHYGLQYRHVQAFKEKMRERDYVAMITVALRRPIVFRMILRGVRWRLRALLYDQRFVGP
jgi:succinoglycan biosynthesis protein ExoO